MMRQFQNVLFVIGATSAGLVWSAGLAFTMALGILPSGRDAGGAVVVFMILAACGAVFGAVIGLVGSIRRISQRPTEPWTLMTWIGMLVGLAAGFALRVSTVLDASVAGDLIKWLPATLLFLAMMAFLGGFIGNQ
jgi:hypothetical protein